ncbi:hypothetical protein F5X96DRAFT_667797 [Biscogniauxia mediterranea]|nr:hypothetical protein F5X96DRAFT_667797 [Biscogniauxia mediterranea]
MSAFDSFDGRPYDARRYFEDRRDRVDPRYTETQEAYYRVNPTSRTALVPRAREESDLTVEEVRRDFPPPGYSRDIRRARSAEPGHDDYYYDSRRSYERDHYHGKKPASVYYEEEERSRKRVLSKQEKIIAAVAGGLLAAGAKEVWDRREAEKEGVVVQRNIAASAALGAAGALAGYQGADFYNKHAAKEDKKSTYLIHKGRDGRVSEYYSDDDEDPKNRKGNKSFLENALSAAGLGTAIKALTGGDDKDRDDRYYDSRSRNSSPDSYRSYHSSRSHRSHRSRDDPAKRMQKAAKASLVAGAAEAFRVAREPGGWQGEKMKRVLTAAAGAATIDAAHDPSKDSKRHLLESVVGGLLGNRVLNGSRKDIEEDRLTGRSRSRSRARSRSRSASRGGGRSGLAALATAGLGAIGAKKYAESRSRSRSRRHSYDSYDSRSPSPVRHRSRSRSIVDGARRSLAKIGLGSGPASRKDEDSYDERSRSRSRSRRSSRHRSPDSRYSDDYASRGYMRGGRGPEDDYVYDDDRSASGRSRSVSRSRGRSNSVSSSDLGDSDEDKKRTGKMRRKQLITTGLAAVATIHAAHNVYGSIEARNKRQKAVKQGRLSPEEARKLKTKAIMQDAASIGVAALGIKGALSEMKEARELAHEVAEWKEEKKRRHARRAERLQRANADHRGKSRADNWTSPGAPQRNLYDAGPRYTDGNPYSAALPAPPTSYEEMRRQT